MLKSWSVRLGISAAVVVLAAWPAFAAPPAKPARSGDVRITGPHANEEFCKTMVRQLELFGTFDPLDVEKRAKYFANQKKLNADLVKYAPSQFAADVALQTGNARLMMDAQLSRQPAQIKAAAARLRAPANIAASKRMGVYCGASVVP